jgi:hypothetical protein
MPERSSEREGSQDRDRTVIKQRLKRWETRNNTADAKKEVPKEEGARMEMEV